jgi:hypothetical protein
MLAIIINRDLNLDLTCSTSAAMGSNLNADLKTSFALNSRRAKGSQRNNIIKTLLKFTRQIHLKFR